jgi:hypothetical protein
MNTRQLTRLSVLLALVVILVVLAASSSPLGTVVAQDDPAEAAPEVTLNAVVQARPWSCVGAASTPDDDTPHTRFESSPAGGYVEPALTAVGDLYFVCNVTTPIDVYPGEPDWNTLFLTFKDPDAYGYVQATLYRKRLSNGGVTSMGTLTSTDGVGVRQVSRLVSGFDFDTYAYFVRVHINRTRTTSDQEFHIVGLQFVLY